MSITIKNESTLQRVNDLARQLGVGQTTAITIAVETYLKQATLDDRRTDIMSELDGIWRAQRPDELARLAANESVLYDDNGLFA